MKSEKRFGILIKVAPKGVEALDELAGEIGVPRAELIRQALAFGLGQREAFKKFVVERTQL